MRKPRCRCAHGLRHGPYFYLRYQEYDHASGGSRYRREYVPRSEVPRVRRWIRRARAETALGGGKLALCLDELVLLPIGVLLAVKMIPAEILAEHRERARLAVQRPTSRVGAAIIVAVWLVAATIAAILTVRWLDR